MGGVGDLRICTMVWSNSSTCVSRRSCRRCLAMGRREPRARVGMRTCEAVCPYRHSLATRLARAMMVKMGGLPSASGSRVASAT